MKAYPEIRIIILTVLFILCAVLVYGQTTTEHPQYWTPDAMLQVKSIGDVRVSPDGQLQDSYLNPIGICIEIILIQQFYIQ